MFKKINNLRTLCTSSAAGICHTTYSWHAFKSEQQSFYLQQDTAPPSYARDAMVYRITLSESARPSIWPLALTTKIPCLSSWICSWNLTSTLINAKFIIQSVYIHLVYTLWNSLYQIERLLSTLKTHGVWKSTNTHRPVGVNVLFQTSPGRRYGHLFFVEYALVNLLTYNYGHSP